MANVEKLEAVMDHIRMNREQHDQERWAVKTSCGTTMCFAGWTVVLEEGYELKWHDMRTDLALQYSPGLIAYADYCDGPATSGITAAPVQMVAEIVLGLTRKQGHSLFHLAKTFDDVEQTVKDIINAEQAA